MNNLERLRELTARLTKSAKPIKERVVLIVDDNKLDCELHEYGLKKNGYEIIDMAYSIGEAREKMQYKCYDLILLDMALPNGVGTDLSETIQKKCPYAKVAIISGYSFPEVLGLQFFEKPVSIDTVLNKLEEL